MLILGSVAALAFVLWRYLAQQTPVELLEALPKQVDLALEKLHYTQNEDGRRSWTLTADQAEYQRDSGEALLQRVHLVLYRAGQFGEVTLDAGQGRLRQEQQQVEVFDQVVVRTDRQEQLQTKKLIFDGRRNRLTTDEKIRLLTPGLELTGAGLEVDLEQGRMLVKSQVRLLISPAGKDQGTHE